MFPPRPSCYMRVPAWISRRFLPGIGDGWARRWESVKNAPAHMPGSVERSTEEFPLRWGVVMVRRCLDEGELAVIQRNQFENTQICEKPQAICRRSAKSNPVEGVSHLSSRLAGARSTGEIALRLPMAVPPKWRRDRLAACPPCRSAGQRCERAGRLGAFRTLLGYGAWA
jgi:hypothetical protein